MDFAPLATCSHCVPSAFYEVTEAERDAQGGVEKKKGRGGRRGGGGRGAAAVEVWVVGWAGWRREEEREFTPSR